MTTKLIVILALLLVPACAKQGASKPAADSSASMQGMPGMATSGDTAGIPLDRPAAQRLGIAFARAGYAPVRRTIRLAGTLGYAEPRRTYVNSRVNGWIEGLYADYLGKRVRAGDSLLALYAPELVSAQEEYLAARRLGDSSLVAAARRRLELWNIPADQIAALERRGTADRTLLIRAPRSGEIAEKLVIEGQAVHAGDNLFLIADRSVLWVDAAVFEMDAPAVRIGTPVELTVTALPGRRYHGRVSFLHPSVDEKTRTLTARVEVPNPDGMLRPGMYATGEVSTGARKVLSVPLEAVLPTGKHNLVFVNRGDGRFLPREVVVGARGDSLVEVVRGLKPGDEVIASATYLLDSESNLAAAMRGLMLQMGMGLNMGGMQRPAKDTGKERRP
ncbi:MAG TPA: efflux RND transporter periplasmic adaptor subunit [Gemmatimonadales bacterium]|jgi:Cu(I)/Ag(I) efflux system membrane fusion protein|nr:efflux RND transporter periplasmic adaptor subunit [Gemmatimonadales bacterium]